MPAPRDLHRAISELGELIGRPLSLPSSGSLGLVTGEPAVEVTIEWIERGRCIAVHAPIDLPDAIDRDMLARRLMCAHLAGAATAGCAFWMLTDGSLRVGITLVGPHLDGRALLEPLARVAQVASEIPRRVADLA